MNYTQIESLVKSSKQGNTNSKELLAEAFKPFILNISKRTFINGYDFYDIQNECLRFYFTAYPYIILKPPNLLPMPQMGLGKALMILLRKVKTEVMQKGMKH